MRMQRIEKHLDRERKRSQKKKKKEQEYFFFPWRSSHSTCILLSWESSNCKLWSTSCFSSYLFNFHTHTHTHTKPTSWFCFFDNSKEKATKAGRPFHLCAQPGELPIYSGRHFKWQTRKHEMYHKGLWFLQVLDRPAVKETVPNSEYLHMFKCPF